jgi:DNA-binding beta-propeller fold protein YncE
MSARSASERTPGWVRSPLRPTRSPRRRLRRSAALGATIGLTVTSFALSAPAWGSPTTPARELDAPSGLAFGGGHLWVTNEGGNFVTEINPATGRRVRTLAAAAYRFDRPTAIADLGADLFVTNDSGSVTELRASDGALVRRITGRRYGFDHPVAIRAAGSRLLVLNAGHAPRDGSVTEIAAANGSLVRRVAGPAFGFDRPVALAVAGADAFVADAAGNALTEVDVTSGRLIRRIPGLARPEGVAVAGGHVWVSDETTSAVTEISPTTGRLLRTIDDASYGFGHPTLVTEHAGHVYVATPLGTSPMVTRFSASTGVLSWYMCNNNGPYYFSGLSAFAASGDDLWVASRSGANNPRSAARTGSLTEMRASSGALVRTIP